MELAITSKQLVSIMIVQNATQRDLARAAGYRSHAYVGKLCRGQVKTVTPEAAVRIAAFLGLPLHELFRTRTVHESGTDRPTEKEVA